MFRTLFFALIFCFLHAEEADPFQFSHNVPFASDPMTVVGGVNVISGDFIERSCDLALAGSDPLTLERLFNSHTEKKEDSEKIKYETHFAPHFSFNHYGRAHFYRPHQDKYRPYRMRLNLFGSFGTACSLLMNKHKKHFKRYKLHEKVLDKWVTNAASGILSGATNLKNHRLIHADAKTSYTDTLGCYLIQGHGDRHFFDPLPEGEDPSVRRLSRVERLDRSSFRYFYSHANFHPCKVTSKTSKSSLNFFWTRWNDVYGKMVEGSDGRFAFYTFTYGSCLKRLERWDGYFEDFSYDAKQRLIKKESPDGHFYTLSYYDTGKKDVTNNRVFEVRAPVGEGAEPLLTHRYHYRLFYQIGDGKERMAGGATTIFDALGVPTLYLYNEKRRPTAICYYLFEKLYKSDCFTWRGHELLAHSIKDGAGKEHLATHYTYDSFGNPTTSTLVGDLQGLKKRDSFSLRRTFSKEGSHLLLSEDDGRKKITYS